MYNIYKHDDDGSNPPALIPASSMSSLARVTCDVIEGACTVDCGGPRKIVCDTGPFYEQFDPDFWWHKEIVKGWIKVRGRES